ncbi:MAG: hypothetical protein JXQ26_02490 [Tissierellales bacterium]|nr:hypothetical protein [Tissierellales bacterium]MBN2826825.1 hypothetical protein [Tissierellales bacterium]
MRKIKLILLILGLMLLISGCGNESSSSGSTEASTSSVGQQDMTEVTETSENGVDVSESTENEQETVILSSKTGQELIDSLKIVTPEKMYVRGTSFSEEITVETITYIYKDNMKTVTISEEGEQVSIYNADEGALYTYSESEGMGFVFYDEDDEDYDDEEDEDEDDEIAFGEDLFDGMENILVSAEVRDYDGHEVVYIETATSSPDGEWVTRQWISTQFWYPIKFESVFNGKILGGYDVQEITQDFKVTDDLFKAPSDIEFMDFDNMLDFDFDLDMEEETP